MTGSRAATTASKKAGRSKADRRTARRYPCLSECIVRMEDVGEPIDWSGMIYNISATGIGLALPFPALVGTILQIEPRGGCDELPPLRARVVRCHLQKYVWFHGCELVAELGDDELRLWLTAVLRHPAGSDRLR